MKKKSGKKDKNVGKDMRQKLSERSDTDAVQDERTQTREGFDFGGLPARDLKKNLGCGS